MKALMIAVVGLLSCSLQVNAQQKQSGAIQFESRFDPAAAMEANGIKITPEMKDRLPESSKTDFELLFNATGASYTKVEETEDSNGGGRGGFRFGGISNRDYYYNFLDHKLTAVFDLSDTTYFLDGKLGQADVSMLGRGLIGQPVVEYIKSDEVKKIVGFDCHKVTIKTTSKRKIMEEEKEIVDETVLWYTKDLGFEFSPNPALWTEGAVLSIQSKAGSTLATSIEFRKVSAKDINLPKKGTVITSDAYKAKLEQMMKNRGKGNGQRRAPGN
jgi:GLPGLI family protein